MVYFLNLTQFLIQTKLILIENTITILIIITNSLDKTIKIGQTNLKKEIKKTCLTTFCGLFALVLP